MEEGTNDETEVRALPYVLGLHAFCVVDPTLCAPATDPSQFVVTLQPYLKNQVIAVVFVDLLGVNQCEYHRGLLAFSFRFIMTLRALKAIYCDYQHYIIKMLTNVG